MTLLFTRLVSKFSLSLGRAVYMFITFLLPKLELAFHYVHGPGTSQWIQDCDRLLVGSLKSMLLPRHCGSATRPWPYPFTSTYPPGWRRVSGSRSCSCA
jgi:hypothetical protein